MAETLEGKIVGDLVISSDYVVTRDAVSSYITQVSGDIVQQIKDVGGGQYVPKTELSNEVLKIISANYVMVANYLDGTPEDNVVTIDGGASE